MGDSGRACRVDTCFTRNASRAMGHGLSDRTGSTYVHVCVYAIPSGAFPHGIRRTNVAKLAARKNSTFSVITMAPSSGRHCCSSLFSRPRRASHTWLAKINGKTKTFVMKTCEKKLHNARRHIYIEKTATWFSRITVDCVFSSKSKDNNLTRPLFVIVHILKERGNFLTRRMTDSLRTWHLLQLLFCDISRCAFQRHRKFAKPPPLSAGELMLSRLASRLNAARSIKLIHLDISNEPGAGAPGCTPSRPGLHIEHTNSSSGEFSSGRSPSRELGQRSSVDLRGYCTRHPHRVPWIMHIFHDMSAWVMDRHVALTGCKLEWENRRRHGRNRALRFRQAITEEVDEETRSGSYCWEYEHSNPQHSLTLCILAFYPPVYRKKTKTFFFYLLIFVAFVLEFFMILFYILSYHIKNIKLMLWMIQRIIFSAAKHIKNLWEKSLIMENNCNCVTRTVVHFVISACWN